MTFPVAGSPACFFAPGTVGPVAYDGRELWLSYRVPVATGDHIRILFEQFTDRPRQGLRIALGERQHRLTINAQEADGFTLWCDTAPRQVDVLVTKAGRRGDQLILWNVWQDEKYGTMLYGLNWAAMDARKDSDGALTLRCSDGYGQAASFDDIVARVIIDRPTPASRPAA